MRRKRGLCRVDIEPRAEAEIIRAFGVIRDVISIFIWPARGRIRRDKDNAMFRAGAAVLALFCDIRMGTGQANVISVLVEVDA